jgi:hypothetical protein
MNDTASDDDQADEGILTYSAPDEALGVAAGAGPHGPTYLAWTTHC